jgi:hypothetical protein
MIQKDHKIKEMLRELAAEFFSRTSNRLSLITVTNVEVLSRGGKAIDLDHSPTRNNGTKALEFAHRQLSHLEICQRKITYRIPYSK